MKKKIFGLIGKTLSHSFSQKYFMEKFAQEGLSAHSYELFELADIKEFSKLRNTQGISGLNVTIPYKESIMPFLDEIEPKAAAIGAVNVISISETGRLKGHNSDYYGFKQSLREFLGTNAKPNALVLGSGGAAKAVWEALKDLNIGYKTVSRTAGKGDLVYGEINTDTIREYPLIINTTPLGMYPETGACPPLPYDQMDGGNYLYDLVYNPENTLFMKKGQMQGAKTINGLQMLHLQAEKAWEIWNDPNS